MSCIFSNFNGTCQYFDENNTDDAFPNGMGYDNKGICVVEDDPNPEDSCQNFERHHGEEEE